MTTQSNLHMFFHLLLPREEVVWVRCTRCGHEETRCIDQAGLRCQHRNSDGTICGGCVSVVSDSRRRHTKTDQISARRYWRQGEIDPNISPIDDPAGVLP